jgi:uncharacterized protein (TIGR02001 family)
MGAHVRKPLPLLLALLWLPLPGHADGGWSALVALTSDYVDRGISQTYGGGALQLGGNYQSAFGWFVGAWGSNVDPYPGGASFNELDVYGGMKWPVAADFTVQAAYAHYAYLEDPRPGHYDYDEFSLGIAYLDLLSATVSYQPDSTAYTQLGFAQRRTTLAGELSARWPLRAGFAVTCGAGYYDLHDLFGVGYWAGNAGLEYVHRRLSVTVNRFFSDSTAARLYEDASANRTWVVSGVWRF